MTREEYISKLEKEQAFLYFHLKPMDEKQHNKWINHIFYLIKQSASKIFDDHEAELEALQSRSCEGCKFHDDVGWDDWCCDCIRKWTIDRYEAKEQ